VQKGFQINNNTCRMIFVLSFHALSLLVHLFRALVASAARLFFVVCVVFALASRDRLKSFVCFERKASRSAASDGDDAATAQWQRRR